ncbi:Uncharacterised protein [Mycobacteroides abscessus subsp. abscessus]|nr:Uncharacterised protein [Mycobacteroides abscessus subsp. abscessus]
MISSRLSSSWNTGVSSSCERRYRPINPSGSAIRNGIRQPHVCICSSESNSSRNRTIAVPALNPASVPNSSSDPYLPRLLSGAYSAMNVAAPPYSPPVEKP